MKKYTGFEIAVIGLSGRFPKAENIGQYWENLKEGKNCVSDFSDSELLGEEESETLLRDPLYVKSNAYLENKKYFDASFFDYRPAEAELMDPQIRVFHECCWEALEDSGYSNTDHKYKIGLFASGSPNVNWELYSILKNQEGLVDDFAAVHLRCITFLSSKISYALNLNGPSIFIQTACSSSLVAIHEACNSLLWGECSMALAGGVTIYNHSKKGYKYKEGMILSKDGRCRPFDINASGTIGGEGAGVVVLKRLKDAIQSRDYIYAVIKGTGINNDGNNKVGYTAPSVKGQIEVIRKAHKMADVKPDSISYIETHGTGTELGDPIEIAALNETFGNSKTKYCSIGSVKSNIGHLDSAAGVAGFIKTVLAIKNRQIPASLHFREPNPKIDFDNGPFYVNNVLKEWKNDLGPLRAGVSSFGIGGTNAHVILEESPVIESAIKSRDYQLILLSAKTRDSLERATVQLTHYLKKNKEVKLADIAYTLQKGRARFKYRKMLVCESQSEAINLLSVNQSIEQKSTDIQEGLQNVIFMFSGQGSQYVDMCKDLYLNEKVFRNKVDECLEIAKLYSKENFHSILFSNQEDHSRVGSAINNTRYTQPILFIIEYSLAHLLMQAGINPDYMIGHSIGEYVAACISGVFTVNNALRLVIRRGELMSSVEKGNMLSINISEEQLKPLLDGNQNIDLAVVNSETSLVVSGRKVDIDKFEKQLLSEGYLPKRVHSSHAFHSYMMDDILDKFKQEVSSVKIGKPQIPYVSNVTGKMALYENIKEPSYWSCHLRSTVHFLKGAEILLKKGKATFIELGPGRMLCNYVGESKLKNETHHLINTVRQVKQKANDQKYFTEKLGRLWLNGIKIDWDNYYLDEKRRRVSLPTYSFEKTAYTTDIDAQKLITDQLPDTFKSFEKSIKDCIYTSNWQRSINPTEASELIENQLNFLVFSDQEGFGSHLIKRLISLKQKVIEIRAGKLFRKINKDVLEVNLTEPEELWKYLKKAGVTINNIIYCSALGKKSGRVKYDAITSRLNDGYMGLSFLAQFVADIKQIEKVNLTVVNNHLAQVIEEDEVDPLKATIHGPARIMCSEISNIKCKVIDIPYPFQNPKESNDYISRLINELFYESDDPYVAYRYKSRWVQSFDTLAEHKKIRSNVEIVKNGTYIITGGLGGMGFTFARDLVYQYGANVILVYRSDFPERADWDKWLLRNGKNDPVSRKIQELQKMESTGCHIDLHQVNLCVEDKVKALVSAVKNKHSKINGLIWAAGEVDFGGIILKREKDDFIRYISSKVHGLLLFEKYLLFKGLDFVALFSSIGNVFYQTKFGQVAYNAANEFLENYPHYARKKMGIHVFTINWCDWLNEGMTFNTIMRQEKTEDINFINSKISEGITPQQGVEVFHRCLHQRAPVYTIYKGDLYQAIKSHQTGLKAIKATISKPSKVSHNLKGKGGDLEGRLIEVFSSFFGKDDVSVNDNFFELGGDSLRAMTIIGRINQEVGVQLSIGDIYKCPTVKELQNELLSHSPNAEKKNIPKAPLKKHYVLSSAQKRMYFLQMLDKENTVYNEIKCFWVEGSLDRNKLENSFQLLIERHESLRTSFVFENDAPKQLILDEFTFEIQDFEYNKNCLDETIQSLNGPFDLGDGLLFRLGVVKKNSEEHLMIINSHHIITDLFSLEILKKEFITLYNDQELPELKLQYKDFAEWQQSEKNQQKMINQREFWINEFSQEQAILELPTDFSRPAIKSYKGASLDFAISVEETSRLKSMAETEGTTPFVILLSIYTIFLRKLANQEDIVVGTVTAGRPHADLENIIGMFVNTLPLRNYPKGDLSFNKYLSDVNTKTLACLDNQAYQYEELIDELNVVRDASRNPLFDVMFTYNNIESSELEIPELSFKPYDGEQVFSKFDITLTANEFKGHFNFTLEYATELFRKETIERFIDYFRKIVSTVVVDTNISISEIEILSEKEKHQLLHKFNDTKVDYPKGETIISLFEKQVLNTPNKIAVVYEDQGLTYSELNERTNELAQCLRKEHKIKTDDLVGIMCERSEQMIVGLLGILKSGGAYVPIDPVYPKERKEYILEDSGASILLVGKGIEMGLKYRGKVLHLDKFAGGNYPNLERINTSDDLCYLIYTSGSTGRPKGVMISHYNVINFFAGMSHRLPIDDEDSILAVTSISFDISVLELFWTLCNGMQVVLHSSDISINGLDRYISAEDLSVDFSLFFFSSYLNKSDDKYHLLLEAVKCADREGFKATWVPERHFHEFGGLYPNPSVLSSALAMITKQIELRSGSIVLPLHDEVRIAEEWSVVDNLSKGRVGLSFAAGWNPNDFVLSKGNYKDRQKTMYKQIETVKKLWQGESIKRENGLGKEVELRVFPAPIQNELPVWITSSGNEETFISAGAIGANLLTHLLGQDIEELSKKIKLYRDSRKRHGYNEKSGKVAIMLHTYIGDDIDEVEKLVEQPFIEYLKSSIGLSKVLHEEAGIKEENISEKDKEMMLKNSFRRYYKTASLIGTISSCKEMVKRLKGIGVDEIACLIDFGLEEGKVLEGLNKLKELKELFSNQGNRKRHKPITMMQSTPSFIKLIQEDSGSKKFLKSLKLLLLGGEAVPASLVRGLKTNINAAIYNMYGPTETTIWSCIHKFEENVDKVSVGKPILNTSIYILDKQLQLVPVGVGADMYIGGEGLSRGYWKKSDLSEERFIPNPFNKSERIYKTGDIARWLPDGNIELIGREDYQVKIRGHRIELGEIENSLLSFEKVREAVVIANEEKSGESKYLVGYVTSEAPLDHKALRAHLSKSLPDYMIPNAFVQLKELPLTPNGKIDRKTLPDPEIQVGDGYKAPSNEAEKKLVEIWSKVLDIDTGSISVNSSFFELGGHSIRAIHLINEIHKMFSVNIELRTVFENTSIENLAEQIENMSVENITPISKVEKKEYYPASPAQKRLYYQYLLDKKSTFYNNNISVAISGEIDLDRIKKSFQILINRHEGLRTSFIHTENDVLQKIRDEINFELDFLDPQEYESIEDAFNDFIRPFDLSMKSLMRCGFLICEEGNLLFLDVHHIVADGMSLNVMINDFKKIYLGIELKPLDLKYKDYSMWMNNTNPQLKKQQKFWLKKLSGKLPRIDLPIIQERDSVNIQLGSSQKLKISQELCQDIKKFAIASDVSDFMFFLSIYYILISKVTDNSDIIIGTEALGRSQPVLKDIVGTFVNVLPLRVQVKPESTYMDFLNVIKECFLEAFDNQDFQFDQMVSLFSKEEKIYRNPIFDVSFSFLNTADSDVEISKFQSVSLKANKKIWCEYEISLSVIEVNDEMHLSFIYSRELYDNEMIKLLMLYYHNILKEVLKNKHQHIENIEMDGTLAGVF